MKKSILLLSLVLMFTATLPTMPIQAAKASSHWEDSHTTIAHALGQIDGMNYTNCLEAFLENYKKGHRVFEVDIALSTDHKLVALHDWYTFWKLTHQQGMNGRATSFDNFTQYNIDWRYTVVTGDLLIELLETYPDIYFVTDTKSIDPETFKLQMQQLVIAAKKSDEKLLDRIIIQVYNNTTAEALKEVYPFKNTIYTLYASPDKRNIARIVDTLKKYNIRVLTLPPELISPEIMAQMNALKIKVFTHTINTTQEVRDYLNKGIAGFYTDALTPYSIEHADDPIASQNITFKLGGEIINPAVPAFQEEDTILIPLRTVCEYLGATVSYSQSTNKIIITYNDSIELTIGDKIAQINGETKHLLLPPRIVKDNTMVPAPFLAEIFNLPITWDDELKLLTIG